MPDLSEIKSLVDNIGKNVSDLRDAQTQQQKEIERLGKSDPLDDQKIQAIAAEVAKTTQVKDQLDQIAQAQSEQKDRMDQIETTLSRPGYGGPAGDEKMAERAAAFQTVAKAINGRMQERVDPENADVEGYKHYLKAFDEYLRRGQQGMDPAAYKALSEGRDPSGGFLVDPVIDNAIMEKAREISPMRSLVRVRTGGAPVFKQRVKKGQVGASRVSETQRRDATGTPQYGTMEITAFDLHAAPSATTDLLEDASINLIADLQADATEEFVVTEAREILQGSGVNEARGLLTLPQTSLANAGDKADSLDNISVIHSGAAEDFTDTDLLFRMAYSIKSVYQAGASWLMNTGTLVKIMTFKDNDGQYLWRPGLQAGQPSTLIGKPLRVVDDMPAIAANSLPLSYGNWTRAYTWYERRGIRVLRDDYTEHPFVVFKMTKRSGGAPVNPEAYVNLKIAT